MIQSSGDVLLGEGYCRLTVGLGHGSSPSWMTSLVGGAILDRWSGSGFRGDASV
ncbi:hypothetical protein Ae717Ps2_5827 [Pseudonocardia sp. Ae717_Ps2]|nr:hypothetical protein Ae717Ps2_5827 [Pseudonocardia sp. Ae717_Ps2]